MKKAIVYVLKYGDETKLLAQADGTEKENLTLYDMLDTKTNLYAISEKCKTGTGKKQKAEMRIIIVDENNQPDKKWQFVGRLIDIDKEGKDIMIGFNPKFLMDALRVIDDENVTMYLVNHKSPCFIRDKEENYIYLILPVNFTA